MLSVAETLYNTGMMATGNRQSSVAEARVAIIEGRVDIFLGGKWLRVENPGHFDKGLESYIRTDPMLPATKGMYRLRVHNPNTGHDTEVSIEVI